MAEQSVLPPLWLRPRALYVRWLRGSVIPQFIERSVIARKDHAVYKNRQQGMRRVWSVDSAVNVEVGVEDDPWTTSVRSPDLTFLRQQSTKGCSRSQDDRFFQEEAHTERKSRSSYGGQASTSCRVSKRLVRKMVRMKKPSQQAGEGRLGAMVSHHFDSTADEAWGGLARLREGAQDQQGRSWSALAKSWKHPCVKVTGCSTFSCIHAASR